MTTINQLLAVKSLGQRLWLDNLSRSLLESGALTRLIEEDGIAGVTSNPSIFYNAIRDDIAYQTQLDALRVELDDLEARYESLIIPDIKKACDLNLVQFENSNGEDGWVSLEVSPNLAHDVDGTVENALRFVDEIHRPNLMIKIPATVSGLKAMEILISRGVSVNATLVFSLKHTEGVAQAYLRGIKQLISQGKSPRAVKAVASYFLSRVDTLVDKEFARFDPEKVQDLYGKTAVNIAKLAYQRYQDLFSVTAPTWSHCHAAHARPLWLLWASTGTKNPAYSDVKYIEELIAIQTVNTVPDATLNAFRDHGTARLVLNTPEEFEAAAEQHARIARLGLDLDIIGEQLQREGLAQFEQAYAKLLKLME